MIVGCFDVSRGLTDVSFLIVAAKHDLCCVLNALEILLTFYIVNGQNVIILRIKFEDDCCQFIIFF